MNKQKHSEIINHKDEDNSNSHGILTAFLNLSKKITYLYYESRKQMLL